MPEDNSHSGPDPFTNNPKPQPKINSLDGFTNSPHQPGQSIAPNNGLPHAAGTPSPSLAPNNGAPKPVGLQPGLPQTMAAQNPTPVTPNTPAPGSTIGIGGVAKPTVTGIQPAPQPSIQASVPSVGSVGTAGGQPASPFVAQKKSKKKLWISLAAVLVVLLLVGGYAFAFYLPYTPANMYKSSLENTGLAVDKLIDYSHKQQDVHYKSYKFDGKLNVKSPNASFDSTLDGNVGDKNGQVTMTGDFMSTHVKADVRYITKAGNDTPDVYAQVSGVKTVLNQAGAGALAKYDGKWIVIDHTLIDTYVSSIQSMASQSTGSEIANADKSPTDAQVQDAVNKVQIVNKQYIFTGDKSKAVLTQEAFVGKETVNGRTMYHYKVGYNKANLQAYVTAVGQALDSSQLNDWSKKVNSGKSITEAIDIKSVHDAIDKADAKSSFEMWADKGTKLVSMLKFSDAKNASNWVTISQNYTGGADYPFAFGFNSKDTDGSTASGSIGFTVNSSTNKIGMTLKANSKDTTGTTSVDGSLDITPGNESVTVVTPTGATPLTTILNSMGLGSLATPPKTPASINPGALINPSSNTKCPVNDKATCAKYGFTT